MCVVASLCFIGSNQIINIEQQILMVKALLFIKSALQRAKNFIASLTQSSPSSQNPTHASQPRKESKKLPQAAAKKRKLIAKKDMRVMVRRKLQAKHMRGAALEECSSEVDPQLAALSMSSSRSAAEIDAKFTSFLCSHEEELTCSVCRSLMLLPTATTCSHVFCLECIENSLVVSNRCPLCRAPVAGEDTYGIHSLRPIEKLVQIRREREMESEEHRRRIEEHQLWRKNRFVDEGELVPGVKIDIWKTDSREWKRGEVVVREEETLMVSYLNQSKEQNEIIQLPSLRIASHNFYSSRYQADDFPFPDLTFRNSIRQPDAQMNLLPFRRTLQHRLTSNPLFHPPRSPPYVPYARISRFFNNRLPELPAPAPQPPQEPEIQQLGRLQALSPEDMLIAVQRDESDLLPNLNPSVSFRRQAESSSSEEQAEALPFIDHFESDF